MLVFADWRDIANLAYWVTGTEGSNPLPLRHRVRSLRILHPKRRNSPRLRLHLRDARHRRKHFPPIRARDTAKVSVGK